MSDASTESTKSPRATPDGTAAGGSMLRALWKLDRSFWVTNLVFFFDGAAYFGILNLLTLFLGTAVAMGDRTAGVSVSLFTGSVTLSNALLGGLADRLGARRAITYSALVSLLGRGLLAAAPMLPASQWIAWLALAVLGAAQGVLIPACYAAVKQSTDESTSAIGFSFLYVLMNCGALMMGAVSPFVRDHHGLGGPFWMCAAMTAGYLVIHVLGFPTSKGQPVPAAPDQAGAPKRSFRDHALFNPRFLYFIFILLGVRTLFAHQFLTLPHYVLRAYPASVGARLEWIETINPIVILVLMPIITVLTRKANVVTMMLVGTAISAAATFLLVPGPNLSALIAYCLIFSIGECVWSSRFLEYVANSAPPDKVGVYMGVAQIPWFLAKTSTGLYSGSMLAWLCPEEGPQNTSLLWLIYAMVGISSPIGLFLARNWLKRGTLTER